VTTEIAAERAPSAAVPLAGNEVRRLARRGAAQLIGRSIAVRGLGFVGNIVLARLLTPRDFGLVAIGSAIAAFASLVADGGLGAALIRGDHRPTTATYRQLLGFELAIAVVFTGVVAGVAPAVGTAGWVAAVMTASLCLAVFQTPGTIDLERNLMFRQIAALNVVQTVVYVVWAVIGAALGAGVWALATATIGQAVAGVAYVLHVARVRVLRPSFGVNEIRAILSFGARFQAVNLVNLIRDQGLNVGIGAVAGVGVLGIWSMAFRLLQIAYMIFGTIWQVTFPAIARLIEAGEDPNPVVQRMLSRSAVLIGGVLALLGGTTPSLVPTLFGRVWHPIVEVLPWCCVGLLLSGPISVSVAGLLYARGDAATGLRAAILHTIAWLGLTLGLLPVIGVGAVGVGLLAAAIIDGLVLGRRTSRAYHIPVLRSVALPVLASATAGAAGWLIADRLHPLLAADLASAGAILTIFLGLLALGRREMLSDTAGVAWRSVRGAF
jgi:O-antigen/teichoic acid export membrane protein